MRNVLLAGAVLSVIGAMPASAGDAANGQSIAEQRCARCHVIARGGAFKLKPPSFQAIAIYRTADDIWQRIIAPNPHSNMPEVQWTLTPDEVQDLIAYITSLDVPVSLPAQ
jgi:mono/diheme cytochrome c family protein